MKRNLYIVRSGAAPAGHRISKVLRSVFTVALSLCVLSTVSCTEPAEQQDLVEMSFSAVAEVPTKGYVPGGALVDASYEALHGSASAARRNLYLTSWMYDQQGKESLYIDGKRFIQGSGDAYWQASPAVYWPAAARMDFVSWSSGEDFSAAAVTYDRKRATDVLYLTIGPASTQDDVMFSWAGSRVAGNTGIVDMTFYHSQAWIEFSLRMHEDFTGMGVLIHQIVIEDIYTSGELSVRHPLGYAEGSWNFRFDRAEDTVMDDPGSIYGTRMTHNPVYLDMLLPEQHRKDVVFFYSLGEEDNVLQYVYHLDQTATWEMGKKYLYEVVFSPTEITINPIVLDWGAQNVAVPIS